MTPLISVVVPVYNLEAYISATIQSIVNQSLSRWELILINDGSFDSSIDIMKQYESEDSRIHVIDYVENHGPMYAREQGVMAATGKYITFCDGDDTLLSDSLELMVSVAEKEEADLVISQFVYVDSKGNRLKYPVRAKLKYGDDRLSLFKSVLSNEIPQGLCAKAFLREKIRQSPTYVLPKCTRGEDACVLFQYLNRIDKAVLLDYELYEYHIRDNSSTHSVLTDRMLDGICHTAELRYCEVKQYSHLKRYYYRYFQKLLVAVMCMTKNKASFKESIAHYNISFFLSWKQLLRYSGLLTIIRYIWYDKFVKCDNSATST